MCQSEGGASGLGCLQVILLFLSLLLSFGLTAGGISLLVKPEAFVLMGAGVLIWILTALLVKYSEKLRCRGLPANGTQPSAEGCPEVLEERYRVPSYEAVVGSGSLSAVITSGSGSGTHISSSDSQLPSYEDALKMGPGPGVVVGGVEAAPDLSQPQHSAAAAVAAAGASGGLWNGRTAIKSERLRMTRGSSTSSPPPHGGAAIFSIELPPFTPPYDDTPTVDFDDMDDCDCDCDCDCD